MIVFQTIYFRARVGLTSLPTSTPLSGTPVSMKRSIQSNPSAPPKKARLQNEDKNQVKTCDRNLADISLSNPATTNHHLTRLPIEIRMEILGYLPNLRTLLSAILTHSSLYATYLEYSRSIPLAIFRERCRAIQGCDIGDVFWELVFAINHDFVHRDVVKELFACAWDVFHTRHMEDVLIPLGRALALTYRQDHRGEAVHLLRELANGSEPFPRSELPYPKSFHDDPPCLDVILFPVLSLLKKWEKEEVSDDNRWDEPEDRRISHLQRYMRKSQGEGIYNPFILAYVEDTRFRVVGGNAYHVIAYDGIHFPWRHDHAERKLAEVVVVKRGQALPKDLGRDNRRFR
ncbi:hypothetical protein HD806DRAFT_499636 [Xylariaceae sp. AK1471]|nr:hypothetical protein HD806DRAFT_499636 [Xylariaceae sp. AK1471]